MSENEHIELTDREELFCHEYLKDLNGVKSYLRVFDTVTYDSARALSSKLLSNVNIRARIKELMDIRSNNILVDAGYVVESLIHVAEKCQEAEPVLEWDADSKSMVETGEYQFDSNGANKALELIGKHLGMFQDKLKVDVTVPSRVIINPVSESDGDLPTSESEIDLTRDPRYTRGDNP